MSWLDSFLFMRIYENVILNWDGDGDRAMSVVPLDDVVKTEQANVGLAHEVHLLSEENRRLREERENWRMSSVAREQADKINRLIKLFGGVEKLANAFAADAQDAAKRASALSNNAMSHERSELAPSIG